MGADVRCISFSTRIRQSLPMRLSVLSLIAAQLLVSALPRTLQPVDEPPLSGAAPDHDDAGPVHTQIAADMPASMPGRHLQEERRVTRLTLPSLIIQYGEPRTASTLQFQTLCAIALVLNEADPSKVNCSFLARGEEGLLTDEAANPNGLRVVKTHHMPSEGFPKDAWLFASEIDDAVSFDDPWQYATQQMSQKLDHEVKYAQVLSRLTGRGSGIATEYKSFFGLTDPQVQEVVTYLRYWDVLRMCCGAQMKDGYRAELISKLKPNTSETLGSESPACDIYRIQAVERQAVESQVFKLASKGGSGTRYLRGTSTLESDSGYNLNGQYCEWFNRQVACQELPFNKLPKNPGCDGEQLPTAEHGTQGLDPDASSKSDVPVVSDASLVEFCKEGRTSELGRECCPSSCSQCGGEGCSDDKGGSSDCCLGPIHASKKVCSSASDVKCMIPLEGYAAEEEICSMCGAQGNCCGKGGAWEGRCPVDRSWDDGLAACIAAREKKAADTTSEPAAPAASKDEDTMCPQEANWCVHAGAVNAPKMCGGKQGNFCWDSAGNSGFKPCNKSSILSTWGFGVQCLESACACSSTCSRDAELRSASGHCGQAVDEGDACTHERLFAPSQPRAGIVVLERNEVYRVDDMIYCTSASEGCHRTRLDARTILCEKMYRGTLLRKMLTQVTHKSTAAICAQGCETQSSSIAEPLPGYAYASYRDAQTVGIFTEAADGPRQRLMALSQFVEAARGDCTPAAEDQLVVPLRMGDILPSSAEAVVQSVKDALSQPRMRSVRSVVFNAVMHYGANEMTGQFMRNETTDQANMQFVDALSSLCGGVSGIGIPISFRSEPSVDTDLCYLVHSARVMIPAKKDDNPGATLGGTVGGTFPLLVAELRSTAQRHTFSTSYWPTVNAQASTAVSGGRQALGAPPLKSSE